MDDVKQTRFGRKAMSLFLSGAMVVAFAPAVAPAVAEFAGYGSEYTAYADDTTTAAGAEEVMASAAVTGVKVAGADATITEDKKVQISKKALWDSSGLNMEAVVTSITPKIGGVAIDTTDSNYWDTYLIQITHGSNSGPVVGGKVKERVSKYSTNEAVYPTKKESLDPAKDLYLVVTAVDKDGNTTSGNEYAGCSVSIPVELVGESLAGAKAYQVNPDDPDDVSDEKFVYANADFAANTTTDKIGIKLADGTKLTEGTDYTVSYKTGAMASTSTAKDAGKYIAVLTGTGDYSGTATVPFEIEKLDLSTAEIELANVASSGVMYVKSVKAAGEKSASLSPQDQTASEALFTVSPADATNAYTGTATEFGSYAYTVALKNANDTNITGTGSATYETGADVTIGYTSTVNGGANGGGYSESPDNKNVVRIDKSKTGSVGYKKDFFTEAASGQDISATVGDDKLVVEVTNAETGAAATEADLLTAGTWKVKVSVDGKATGYKYKGSAEYTFVVKEGDVKTVTAEYDGAFFSGANKTSETKTYTGKDLNANVVISAYNADGKELVAGTDYEVEITKDGKAVTEAVDAGTYKYTVKGKAYEVSTENASKFEFTLVINKVAADVVVVNPDKSNAAQDYTYTGEAIAPKLQFYKTNATTDNKVDVPAEAYEIAKISWTSVDSKTTKTVTEIKDAGTYKLTVGPDTAYAGKDNYNLAAAFAALKPANTVEVKVGKATVARADLDGVGYTEDQAKVYEYDYTGSAIEPVVTAYDKAAGSTDAKEIALPEGSLKATILKKDEVKNTWSSADEIKEIGEYQVTYELDGTDAKNNFAFADGVNKFNILVAAKHVGYIDVAPGLISDKGIVTYTGKAIAPTYRFWTADPARAVGAEQVNLGAGTYKVSYQFSQQVDGEGKLIAPVAKDEIVEVGYYVPVFMDLNTGDEWTFWRAYNDDATLMIHVAQASDATTVTKLTQKISKVTPTSKTLRGVKKGKLKAKKTFKVKASGAKTAVTFAKANKAGGSKIAVSKAGKVTVKKGTKKGTYKVKVTATAKATTAYKKATKTVTVKITVK